MTERQQIEQAIALQERLRGVVPDSVLEVTIAILREKLAALTHTEPDEQRKLVTVLFADLVGWTALSERLDAEDVREIQRLYFAAVAPPILQRGGRVEKYIGDAVLAVFGVPQAQETDTEYAIRAALAMQQAMVALNDRLAGSSAASRQHHPLPHPHEPLTSETPTSAPLPLSLRIGVHTGPVVATVGQDVDNFVVTGDTVNLAARLQAAAPPGGVVISHDTWRHVEDLFEIEARAPVALKGKAEPVRSYLVLQARPRPLRRNVRGVAGIMTKMVGRTGELETLQDTLMRVKQDRQAQAVTVVGEAGVGKSRLLVEFEAWAALLPFQVTYLKGRAAPEAQHTPYALLRDLFATSFQIEEGDTLRAVRRKLEEGFSASPQVDRSVDAGFTLKEAHRIGQLLGYDFSDSPYVAPLLDDPLQLRTQALAGLEAYFDGLARKDPLLVILEDLHWADDSSLDAFSHLLARLGHCALLVLGAARSSLYRRRPNWGDGLAIHRRVDLQPLSQQAVEQLLQDILQKAAEVPARLRANVLDYADGNPFSSKN